MFYGRNKVRTNVFVVAVDEEEEQRRKRSQQLSVSTRRRTELAQQQKAAKSRSGRTKAVGAQIQIANYLLNVLKTDMTAPLSVKSLARKVDAPHRLFSVKLRRQTKKQRKRMDRLWRRQQSSRSLPSAGSSNSSSAVSSPTKAEHSSPPAVTAGGRLRSEEPCSLPVSGSAHYRLNEVSSKYLLSPRNGFVANGLRYEVGRKRARSRSLSASDAFNQQRRSVPFPSPTHGHSSFLLYVVAFRCNAGRLVWKGGLVETACLCAATKVEH